MKNKKIDREVRNSGKFISVLPMFFFLIILPHKSQAQNVDSLIEVINHSESYKAIEKAKDKIPSYLRKVDLKLLDVVRQMKLAGITHSNAANKNVHEQFSTPAVELNNKADFHINIYFKELDEKTISKLNALGITIQNRGKKYKQITCWVPFDAINALAKDENVTGICNVGKPYCNTDPYKTVGDQILSAVTARSTFGIDGTGIKIGVISDDADNYQDAINAEYLDASLFHYDFGDPTFTGNEGTALSEIVHVLAPKADIHFEAAVSSGNFRDDIRELYYNKECNVIVDDIEYPDEPMFEDGENAIYIDDVTADGAIYISSAGNAADRTWNGMSADANQNTWMEFSGSDETNSITVPGYNSQTGYSRIVVNMQWANSWDHANDDFDLYLYAGPDPSSQLLASSTNSQNGGPLPQEFAYWTNYSTSPRTVYLRVKLINVSASREVMMVVRDVPGPLSHIQGGHIWGHAAAYSCISVGAINSSDGQTIENFSSKGPVRIYFYDLNGDPTSYTDFPAPVICGIDNVTTWIGSASGLWPPGDPTFYGTSAAAPHIAAIAALILQQHGSSLNWEKVKYALTLSADKVPGMGGQNFTNVYGFGRSNAYTACRNLYVPQVYSTIQSALNAAISGQTIVIGSGTYNENLTVGNRNNLTITGQGAANTIINGSLTAYFSNNLNISALRLNNITAIYCNLGDFHNNIYNGGMGLSSCTGFDQFGYISNCSTGLTASFSTGHIYPTSNFSSNGTSIYSTGSGNILVDCSHLCTSTNYDFAASTGSYISSYLSYFRNGQPRIHYLGGTVSVNYPTSCGLAKESNTADIQDDYLLTPIQSDDPVETEFSKINISYFNLLKEIKKAKEKGVSDNVELKNQLFNNANDFKNFIKKNPQSSLSLVALNTAASSFRLYEDNTGMKNLLDEIINDKDLVSLRATAENLMIDYYINIKDFEGAISIADTFIYKYKSDDDLLCEGLFKKGIILAHKMNEPEKAIESFTAIENNHPNNSLAGFAKNELKVLGKEGSVFNKENLTAENLEFSTSSYPNPFNPTTIIKYSLPTDEKVIIKVYDILGREITVLVNEFKTAGTYSVQFDGTNLSSGVYVYSIEAGKISQTNKLILTK